MDQDRPATSNACFIAKGEQTATIQSLIGKKYDGKELNSTKSLRYSKGLKALAANQPDQSLQQQPKKSNFLESFMKKTKRNTAATAKQQQNTSQDSTTSTTSLTELVKPPEVIVPQAEEQVTTKLPPSILPSTVNLISSTTATSTPLLSSQSLDQSISAFKKRQLLEIEKLDKSKFRSN